MADLHKQILMGLLMSGDPSCRLSGRKVLSCFSWSWRTTLDGWVAYPLQNDRPGAANKKNWGQSEGKKSLRPICGENPSPFCHKDRQQQAPPAAPSSQTFLSCRPPPPRIQAFWGPCQTQNRLALKLIDLYSRAVFCCPYGLERVPLIAWTTENIGYTISERTTCKCGSSSVEYMLGDIYVIYKYTYTYIYMLNNIYIYLHVFLMLPAFSDSSRVNSPPLPVIFLNSTWFVKKVEFTWNWMNLKGVTRDTLEEILE